MQTYNSLIKSITQWCVISANDFDFAAQLPDFVSLTEQQIFMDMATIGNETNFQSILTPSNPLISKPPLWGKILSLQIFDIETNQWELVERVTFERGTLHSPNPAKTGKPIYYTDYGFDSFQFFPTPDSDYVLNTCYYNKPTPLSINNQTNWNSVNAYDLLFFGCLNKAYMYLYNTSQADYYDAKYQSRITAYQNYDNKRLVDRMAAVLTTIPTGVSV